MSTTGFRFNNTQWKKPTNLGKTKKKIQTKKVNLNQCLATRELQGRADSRLEPAQETREQETHLPAEACLGNRQPLREPLLEVGYLDNKMLQTPAPQRVVCLETTTPMQAQLQAVGCLENLPAPPPL